jgi:streptogramin lyase
VFRAGEHFAWRSPASRRKPAIADRGRSPFGGAAGTRDDHRVQRLGARPQAGGRIGRITTSGTVTEYSQGISPGETPFGIAAGPDGALWFTEQHSAKIGRIATNGTISEYSSGLAHNAGPLCIVAGPDGNMWFTECNINKVGRVNPSLMS